ncbi:hypothetical protein PMI42_04328 [Bradyrhizobium sp. YR681]|nr:hypothetical protein PMI42_04328 [Bradyrhizobium sp. YR681]
MGCGHNSPHNLTVVPGRAKREPGTHNRREKFDEDSE